MRGRHADAAERFLRFAYTYRDGGTAWDDFPAEWRRTARGNARAVLADVRNALAGYPPAKQLATISSPVVCAYGTQTAADFLSIARSLIRAIPTASLCGIDWASHAVAFDAPDNFVKVIAEVIG